MKPALLSPKTVIKLARRNAAKISDFGIEWTRPAGVSFRDFKRTGDLGLEHGVKNTDIMVYYANSKELENANELVRRAFSLEFRPRKETVRNRGEVIMGLVKRHRLDRGSPETKIAALTNEIHQLSEVMDENPHNKTMKSFLKLMIDRRSKLLRHLRTWDYRRFEWVLEKLNLIYRPRPDGPQQVTKKNGLINLTEKYCEELITSKLNAYKKELDREKPEFYRKMAETLEYIVKEEERHGLKRTVSQAEIDAAWEKAKPFKSS